MTGYAVEVNECRIFATGHGKDWWTTQLTGPLASRITWLRMAPGGGVVQIPCADREEAKFVRGHMIEHGIPASAAKVKHLREVTL